LAVFKPPKSLDYSKPIEFGSSEDQLKTCFLERKYLKKIPLLEELKSFKDNRKIFEELEFWEVYLLDKVEDKIWAFEQSLEDSCNMSAKLSALGSNLTVIFDEVSLLMRRYGNDKKRVEDFIVEYMQKYELATKESRLHIRGVISYE
jgi:hypothetical protein